MENLDTVGQDRNIWSVFVKKIIPQAKILERSIGLEWQANAETMS